MMEVDFVYEPEHFNPVCNCTIPAAWVAYACNDGEQLPKYPCGDTLEEAVTVYLLNTPEDSVFSSTEIEIDSNDVHLEMSYNNRDMHNGYHVIAHLRYKQYRFDFLYTCTPKRSAYVFKTRESVEHFVGRVKDRGTIDLKHWFCFGQHNSDDLPDYVVNPHKPEYN